MSAPAWNWRHWQSSQPGGCHNVSDHQDACGNFGCGARIASSPQFFYRKANSAMAAGLRVPSLAILFCFWQTPKVQNKKSTPGVFLTLRLFTSNENGDTRFQQLWHTHIEKMVTPAFKRFETPVFKRCDTPVFNGLLVIFEHPGGIFFKKAAGTPRCSA